MHCGFPKGSGIVALPRWSHAATENITTKNFGYTKIEHWLKNLEKNETHRRNHRCDVQGLSFGIVPNSQVKVACIAPFLQLYYTVFRFMLFFTPNVVTLVEGYSKKRAAMAGPTFPNIFPKKISVSEDSKTKNNNHTIQPLSKQTQCMIQVVFLFLNVRVTENPPKKNHDCNFTFEWDLHNGKTIGVQVISRFLGKTSTIKNQTMAMFLVGRCKPH